MGLVVKLTTRGPLQAQANVKSSTNRIKQRDTDSKDYNMVSEVVELFFNFSKCFGSH